MVLTLKTPHKLQLNTMLCLIGFWALMAVSSCTGYKNVMIGQNLTGEGYGPCEPSIAVNPANPQNIVAGAVLNNAYYSTDGGKHWQQQKISSSHGVWGDPCIVADAKGHFYYFHLSNPSGQARWETDKLDRMVCQKSVDQGKTWSDGSFAGLNTPKDQDKEWAVVNLNNGHIYLTWTQFDVYSSKKPEDKSNILFAKSTDGGLSWSASKTINQYPGDCIDDDQTTEGAVPAVGPNGEIYVAWSFDNKIYFDKSTDQGETWMEKDVVVAGQPGGWSIEIPGVGRANGMPITTCDIAPNSPHKGTIYINWADQRNGATDTDIWLAKSTDGGATWSQPLRVNNDPPGKQQFFTWMATDPVTGYIYIVFYDRRKHDDNHTDVYLAWSKDGGQTFKNEKITQKAFLPKKGVFFGDYNNISVYDGTVRPIWTQQKGNILSVHTALIQKK